MEKKKAPKGEREQTTIRLPEELKEEVQRQADKMGMGFNDFVLTILDKYVNQQG
ncbi:hypothetical protein LQZ18_08380 [Lachnospiraceae bacterium ZAX-1]